MKGIGMVIRNAACALCMCLCICGPLRAERNERLFVIERNYNANVVVYDANLAGSGSLDESNPVRAYWVLNEEGRRRAELNFVERSRAYGFEIEQVVAGLHYRMFLKSFRQKVIQILFRHKRPYAIASIGGRMGYLSRIYVHSDRDGLFPRVYQIDLHGKDLVSGKALYERIVNQ